MRIFLFTEGAYNPSDSGSETFVGLRITWGNRSRYRGSDSTAKGAQSVGLR